MRAIRYHEAGDPSVLQIDEIERPTPASDEVLVEVRAASVNPVDAKVRQRGVPNMPKTTGSDVAGVVVEGGDSVHEYKEGDRVFATGLHTTRFTGGSFADFVTVPVDLLAHVPEGVSFEDAAAVALVGVTAWRAFVHHARLEPGETAFIHGGNGGVGHIAVQLADVLGATSVATARPEHHDTVREMGAESVLDYERADLADAAIAATGGADVVLDHIPDTYLGTNVDISAIGGDVVIIAGEMATLPDASTARSKELDIHLMSMSNLATEPDMPDIGPILDRLGGLMADGRLDVMIDRTLTFEEAAEAHRAVMEESIVGKIVVVP